MYTRTSITLKQNAFVIVCHTRYQTLRSVIRSKINVSHLKYMEIASTYKAYLTSITKRGIWSYENTVKSEILLVLATKRFCNKKKYTDMELTCEKRNISPKMAVNNRQQFSDNDAKGHKISSNNKRMDCSLLQVSSARQREEKIVADTYPCRAVLDARVLLRQLQQDNRREKTVGIRGGVSPSWQGRRNSHPSIDLRHLSRNISNPNASGCFPMSSGPLDSSETGKYPETRNPLEYLPSISHPSVSETFSLNNMGLNQNKYNISIGLPMIRRRRRSEGNFVKNECPASNDCRTPRLEGCIYNKKNSGRRWSVGCFPDFENNGRRRLVGQIEGRRRSVGHIEGKNNGRRWSVGHIEGKNNGRRWSVGHIEGRESNEWKLSVGHIEGRDNERRRSVGHIEGKDIRTRGSREEDFVEQDAGVKARIAVNGKKRNRGAPGNTEKRLQVRNDVTLKLMKCLEAARERMDTQTLLEIKRLQTGREYWKCDYNTDKRWTLKYVVGNIQNVAYSDSISFHLHG